MAGRRLSRKLVLPAKERQVMKSIQFRGSAAATGTLGEDAEPVKQLIYGALDPVRKRNQSDPQR